MRDHGSLRRLRPTVHQRLRSRRSRVDHRQRHQRRAGVVHVVAVRDTGSIGSPRAELRVHIDFRVMGKSVTDESARIIDVSHTIEDGMITYHGLPGPRICDYLSREASRERYAEGTEFQIGEITMIGNTG